MQKENNIVRFPRPMGVTAMLTEYHQTGDPELLRKAQDYLVNQWLLNNGNLCGISYDIHTFASKLGIDINYIREFMRDRVLNSRIWDPSKQQEMLNGLLGEQLMWVLEDRMEIANQVNILKESQGGKYTPFISAELGKALKLKLEAGTSLQSIVRGFTGGSTTNFFTQINTTTEEKARDTVTLEEARAIIIENQRISSKTEEAKLLESRYAIGDLPEVVATKQEGIDVAKEGLNINKQEISQSIDDYKGALAISSKEHHELRREIENNIDPEDPDPEFEEYVEFDEEDEPDTMGFARSFLSDR